jgi:hypothetical protein
MPEQHKRINRPIPAPLYIHYMQHWHVLTLKKLQQMQVRVITPLVTQRLAKTHCATHPAAC